MAKVFRVFLSSTFRDFTLERNYLHKEIFPKLKKFCQTSRADFQAVDLRWGITDEAANDHKTMEICMADSSSRHPTIRRSNSGTRKRVQS